MQENIVIYGSGGAAKELYSKIGGNGVLAVVDRDTNAGKSVWGGVTVRSDDVLKVINRPFDLIIASQYYDKIYKRLLADGKLSNPLLGEVYTENYYKMEPPYGPNTIVEERQWKWLYEHFKDNYSLTVLELIRKNRGNAAADDYKKVKDVLEHAGDEDYWKSVKGRGFHSKAAVIDCGAYVGDSIDAITAAISRPIDAYYALEPMEESFKVLSALHPANVKHFYPIQKGVGLKNEMIETSYNEEQPDTSSLFQKVGEASTIKIEITKLDYLPLGDTSDTDFYIKMDIEGSELDALRGAERLIRESRPNLAICLYHRASDVFKIPQYIDSLGLGYEFHLSGGNHTIMIAVPTR